MKNLTISVIGAGGKMGQRITANLRRQPHRLLLVEKSAAAVGKLREQGLAVSAAADAVPASDVVILAVPDAAMAAVSADVVPRMRPGAVAILLDPAAANNDEVHLRDDCSFVVTHPCHPPLFGEQDSPEARRDFFGGIHAKQDIVVALHRGTEESYRLAEEICRAMFAPVVKAHRITVEQMAMLEPAMAEVCAASAAKLMKDALDEAIARGVPAEAARSFMLGHAQIPLAIVFGEIPSPFSDAAKIAMQVGAERVIRSDWRSVFEPAEIRATIHRMLHHGDRR
jgi:D-apionate oxidoisomerase